jgi:hypothetical protein
MNLLKVKVKFLLNVPIEREETFKVLKRTVRRLEQIANDTRIPLQHRLRAYQILGYVCQVLAGIVKDFEMDQIRHEVEVLEKAIGHG